MKNRIVSLFLIIFMLFQTVNIFADETAVTEIEFRYWYDAGNECCSWMRIEANTTYRDAIEQISEQYLSQVEHNEVLEFVGWEHNISDEMLDEIITSENYTEIIFHENYIGKAVRKTWYWLDENFQQIEQKEWVVIEDGTTYGDIADDMMLFEISNASEIGFIEWEWPLESKRDEIIEETLSIVGIHAVQTYELVLVRAFYTNAEGTETGKYMSIPFKADGTLREFLEYVNSIDLELEHQEGMDLSRWMVKYDEEEWDYPVKYFEEYVAIHAVYNEEPSETESEEPSETESEEPSVTESEEPSEIESEEPTAGVGNDYSAKFENESDVAGKVALTEEEKTAIANGDKFEVLLDFKDVGATATTNEQKAIENALVDKVLGTFLEIDLTKRVGTTEVAVIETTGLIAITFEVPESLKNTDKDVNRTYSVLRYHDGKVDTLDAKYDVEKGTMTFETDKFSTYAIVYSDITTTPNMGDTSAMFLVYVILGAGLIFAASRKKTRI